MKDLALYDNGQGGDLIITNKDLELSNSLANQAYLAMFGGNPKESTSNNSSASQRFDFWGNFLLLKDYPNKQFNSLTEKTLSEISLNSQGRVALIHSIEQDLNYLNKLVDLTIDVLFSNDRVTIFVKMKSKDNSNVTTLEILWNGLKNEVIEHKIL